MNKKPFWMIAAFFALIIVVFSFACLLAVMLNPTCSSIVNQVFGFVLTVLVGLVIFSFIFDKWED